MKQSAQASSQMEFEMLCHIFQRSCTSVLDAAISLGRTLSGKGKTDRVCLISSSLVHI